MSPEGERDFIVLLQNLVEEMRELVKVNRDVADILLKMYKYDVK